MDYQTKLNGEDVTFLDVTDPAYVAPTTGYVIHLNTPQARRFVRAELDQNRAEKDEQVDLRIAYEDGRVNSIAQRDGFVAAKTAAIARIDELQLRIDEQRGFLQDQGDDPDA